MQSPELALLKNATTTPTRTQTGITSHRTKKSWTLATMCHISASVERRPSGADACTKKQKYAAGELYLTTNRRSGSRPSPCRARYVITSTYLDCTQRTHHPIAHKQRLRSLALKQRTNRCSTQCLKYVLVLSTPNQHADYFSIHQR